jgi:hypothetical protein
MTMWPLILGLVRPVIPGSASDANGRIRISFASQIARF